VYESESGHAIEIDDTKDHERLHFYHRSGSYVEFGPNGDRAERIQKNKFTVVIGDDSVYVQGDVKLYVDGNVTAEIGGQANITVSGDINATTPNLNLTGNLNVNGSAIITGDVTAQGTSVHTHTHSGVQSGGGNTGSPN
jgi:phage baseplate assembly protein gpV